MAEKSLVKESTLTDALLFDPELPVVLLLLPLDDDLEDEPHAASTTAVPIAAAPTNARLNATFMRVPISWRGLAARGRKMTLRLYPYTPSSKHSRDVVVCGPLRGPGSRVRVALLVRKSGPPGHFP